MLTAPEGADWVGLSDEPLPVAEASAWLVLPTCGAVVTFSGTARDHAAGREDVTALEYEAYEQPAVDRMREVAAEARRRWPAIGRLVLLHRTGSLALGDSAVIVGASSPHRAEAFDAARWCIDAVKASVPIWKHETWAGGASFGTDAQHLVAPGDVPDPAGAPR